MMATSLVPGSKLAADSYNKWWLGPGELTTQALAKSKQKQQHDVL
jgi:hypothetical protein